jgi:hypothetical protein
MTRVVVEASVVVKWLLPFRSHEADAERALELLRGIKAGWAVVVQPPPLISGGGRGDGSP